MPGPSQFMKWEGNCEFLTKNMLLTFVVPVLIAIQKSDKKNIIRNVVIEINDKCVVFHF